MKFLYDLVVRVLHEKRLGLINKLINPFILYIYDTTIMIPDQPFLMHMHDDYVIVTMSHLNVHKKRLI